MVSKDITPILANWRPSADGVAARKIIGEDGVELLQLRIEMGLLQMYLDGRPDGEQPEGYETVLAYYQSRCRESGGSFDLDEETRAQLDREIMQFYHRRIALLAVGSAAQARGEIGEAIACYRRAVRDANHNLRVMDFIRKYCDDEEYVEGHERHRPFVLWHRTLALAQEHLLRHEVEEAIETIKAGQAAILKAYEARGQGEQADQDASLAAMRELEQQVRRHHGVTKTLREQLEEAVANEEFERAAQLRDQIRARQQRLDQTD